MTVNNHPTHIVQQINRHGIKSNLLFHASSFTVQTSTSAFLPAPRCISFLYFSKATYLSADATSKSTFV